MKVTVYADIPDIDVIVAEGAYYMVSTTMHLCPGIPIMKSMNLKDWEIVNYVYDTFEEDDLTQLKKGKHMYSHGSWAASLKYNKETGLFYVGFNSNDHGFYVYTTDDIEHGLWKKYSFEERPLDKMDLHDPALYFENERLFVLSAQGGRCKKQEINLYEPLDAKKTEEESSCLRKGILKKVGEAKLLFTSDNWSLWEGCHVSKIGDYHYVFIIASPKNRWMRTQLCYRKKGDLSTGDWEECVLYQDGLNQCQAGLAQGGIIESIEEAGKYYGYAFQDMGALGRCPSFVNVKWEQDWPYFAPGEEGEIAEFSGLVASDDFKGNVIKKVWQWNHNPISSDFELLEEGKLRLKSSQLVDNIYFARNTISQRVYGEDYTVEVCLDASKMKIGDTAGLVTMSDEFSLIGVKLLSIEKYPIEKYPIEKYPIENLAEENFSVGKFVLIEGKAPFLKDFADMMQLPLSQFLAQKVYVKAHYVFQSYKGKGKDYVEYGYSFDGEHWFLLGLEELRFSTDTTFMGTRCGLCYFSQEEIGGYADFNYYKVTGGKCH